MKTWSVERVVEGVLGGAILAAQKIVDAGISVGRCFRGLGSDWDTTLEGPEWLAQKEAEDDVTPAQFDELWRQSVPTSTVTQGSGICACGHWLHFGNLCAACGCDKCSLRISPETAGSPTGADADGDASPESPSASPLDPTPASFDSIKNIIAVALLFDGNEYADALGRIAAAAVVSTFDVTWKPERESTWSALGEGGPW